LVLVAIESGYAKGRATRSQIIEKATALFGEVGYRSASLREIASRCGISHPGLLHHFASKELLLQAVLERRDRVDAEWLGLHESRGVETLARLVALVAHNAGQRGLVELFATLSAEATSPEHPAHGYFVERYRGAIAGIGEAFREAQADGALRDGVDPDGAARELVALMDGLQVQWLLDPSATDMPRLVRAQLERQLVVPLGHFEPQEESP
jgi:AcrR family transcriptional regulator